MLTKVRPLRAVTIVRWPVTVRLMVTPFAVWMDRIWPPGANLTVVPFCNLVVVVPRKPGWLPLLGLVWAPGTVWGLCEYRTWCQERRLSDVDCGSHWHLR